MAEETQKAWTLAVIGGRAKLTDAQEEAVWATLDQAIDDRPKSRVLLVAFGPMGIANVVRYWCNSHGFALAYLSGDLGGEAGTGGVILPDLCLAFPGGGRTARLAQAMVAAGVPFVSMDPEGWNE